MGAGGVQRERKFTAAEELRQSRRAERSAPRVVHTEGKTWSPFCGAGLSASAGVGDPAPRSRVLFLIEI